MERLSIEQANRECFDRDYDFGAWVATPLGDQSEIIGQMCRFHAQIAPFVTLYVGPGLEELSHREWGYHLFSYSARQVAEFPPAWLARFRGRYSPDRQMICVSLATPDMSPVKVLLHELMHAVQCYLWDREWKTLSEWALRNDDLTPERESAYGVSMLERQARAFEKWAWERAELELNGEWVRADRSPVGRIFERVWDGRVGARRWWYESDIKYRLDLLRALLRKR